MEGMLLPAVGIVGGGTNEKVGGAVVDGDVDEGAGGNVGAAVSRITKGAGVTRTGDGVGMLN